MLIILTFYSDGTDCLVETDDIQYVLWYTKKDEEKEYRKTSKIFFTGKEHASVRVKETPEEIQLLSYHGPLATLAELKVKAAARQAERDAERAAEIGAAAILPNHADFPKKFVKNQTQYQQDEKDLNDE